MVAMSRTGTDSAAGDGRTADTKAKIAELQLVLTEGSGEALNDAASRARTALEFRYADAMIGLDSVDEELVEQLAELVDEATYRSAELGNIDGCLAAAELAWQEQDETRSTAAFEFATKADAAGVARATYLLGLFHFNGFGTHEDLEASFATHERAAKLGSADAMFELYVMSAQDLGCDSDYEESLRWCFAAGEAGNARAMSNVGGMYATGNGVELDMDKAVEWYARAAHAGHGKAAATLGVMYATGGGVDQSVENARTFFSLASETDFDWEEFAELNDVEPEYFPL
jgi:TPR repeat protein